MVILEKVVAALEVLGVTVTVVRIVIIGSQASSNSSYSNCGSSFDGSKSSSLFSCCSRSILCIFRYCCSSCCSTAVVLFVVSCCPLFFLVTAQEQ